MGDHLPAAALLGLARVQPSPSAAQAVQALIGNFTILQLDWRVEPGDLLRTHLPSPCITDKPMGEFQFTFKPGPFGASTATLSVVFKKLKQRLRYNDLV